MNSLWSVTAKCSSFPSVQGDLKTDVLIVGGGLAGILCLKELTDAGVDFIVFDTTNGVVYESRVKDLISVWYEYLEMGVDVPKIAFYTNSSSGRTMQTIYAGIYKNKQLNKKYPRLSELWYQWDNKPMIVGNVSEASNELKE